ncbi:phosphonate transport system ATP-binding protein [Cyclobacterium xiamenense]|uniref:Phosphonate transport system ATP-binding protein n=1 Tax=Cyclobacterium xiamenense TaxID=1297121 RepID=A0A1H6TH73_9BACT|nr:ATP-binding cassette domain-containing protein [Cyclobacterium xiamenense]SEI79361.1 phosphonate transport system ATP-binding protein [Cyclobacterium xiamenense]
MKLQVKGITKVLPNDKKLLDQISFEVKKGEFVGIIGKSGAGKTLTLKCINGLLKPDSGSVCLIDEAGKIRELNRVKGKKLRETRQMIGVVFQGFHLVKRLTSLENVLIGRLGSISPWRSILLGFTDKEAHEALDLLEKVGIKDLAFRRLGSLSGGEMQRVAIARALFQSPAILLADEPIANLDPANALAIMQLLQPLKSKMPVVGVFHQPEMVARFCTRVIGLKNGQVIYDGEPRLEAAQLLEIYGEELGELSSLAY